MQHNRERREHERRQPTTPGRPRVVVADDGIAADVVILDTATATAVGSSFRHRNREWVIRGRRRHSRVLVAAPAESVEHEQ